MKHAGMRSTVLQKIGCVVLMMSLLLGTGGLTMLSSAADTDAIYVSPDGDDHAQGTASAPLASLSAAKALAKEKGASQVWFRAGSYTLTDTVSFTSQDQSGVTYAAYPGETVTFTAGTPYTGFEDCTVNGVRALKKYVGTQADFNVLFNGETTLPRTRYPESGYLLIRGVDDRYCINPDLQIDANFHKGYTALIADKKDIPAMRNVGDVVVRVLHFWKDEMLRVKSYDAATGVLSFTKPSSMTFHKNDRYFLENVFEALDKPGEWYLDKPTGTLYYIPQAGETAQNLTLWGSETETLLSIDGADNIRFERIVFRGNGFNIPEGRDHSQAAYNAPSCIVCQNAKGLAFRNCEFRDVAACAVFLGENVQEAAVENCLFRNIGAQAVYIRGRNLQPDDPRVTRNIRVVNNSVSGFGRVFFNAVGVLVIDANSVTVAHNEICDGYYTAISVGWVWGFSHNITYNNTISDNLIYNIGQGWLSDMGGIYMLGVQPGTVISGNVIHNVAADPGEGGYGGWGVYLDEGSSEMLVENNLVFACGSDGYHLHYGHMNTVRNNIFALNAESQIRVVSALHRVQGDPCTARFERNILLTDGRALTFSHLDSMDAFAEDGNILWDLTYGKNVYLAKNGNSGSAMSYETARRKGYAANAKVVNPMFRDAARFDFALAEDSPVFALGFVPFDYTAAGTQGGTVIGLSALGGETPYNAHAAAQQYIRAREPFHFLLLVWYRIVDFFTGLFAG
ncbi:MAG: right-handed parallel beta-helix repeat-containing protein [Clostridia bacterium]|nr:right-handed parallel beta-helix repeat-containing protein [Clostridia bacterium]